MLNKFPFFSRKQSRKTLSLSTESAIRLETIDIELIADYLSKAFVIPDGCSHFIINAISQFEGLSDFTIVYASYKDNQYAIHIQSIGHAITSCEFFCECLYLQPESQDDWDGHFSELAEKALIFDGISYQQMESDSLTKAMECLTINGLVTRSEIRFKQFERTTDSPDKKKERLLVVVSDGVANGAGITFYVGIDVSTSSLSILGN